MNKSLILAAVSAAAVVQMASAANYVVNAGATETWTSSIEAEDAVTVHGNLAVNGGAFGPGTLDLIKISPSSDPVATLQILSSGTLTPGDVTVDGSSTLNVLTTATLGSLSNSNLTYVAAPVTVTGAFANNHVLQLGAGGSLLAGDGFANTDTIRGTGTIGRTATSVAEAAIGGVIDPGDLNANDLTRISTITTERVDSLGEAFFFADVGSNGSQFVADQIHMQGVNGIAVAPAYISLGIDLLGDGGESLFVAGDSFVLLTADQPIDLTGTTFDASPLNDGLEFALILSGDQKTVSVSVVPEPASLAMLGLGAIGLLRRRRA